MVRRPSGVHDFKHDYLCNQWADHNEILSEASLGWGKDCIMFWARSDRNLVSLATDSSHRVIIRENGVATFSQLFRPIHFIFTGNDDMHGSSEEFEIQPDPTPDCGVSCH